MPRPALVHRVALAEAALRLARWSSPALQSVPLAFRSFQCTTSPGASGGCFVAGERLTQLDPEPRACRREPGRLRLFSSLERAEPCRTDCRYQKWAKLQSPGGHERRSPPGREAQKALDDALPLPPGAVGSPDVIEEFWCRLPGDAGALRSRPFSGEDHRSAGSTRSARIGVESIPHRAFSSAKTFR